MHPGATPILKPSGDAPLFLEAAGARVAYRRFGTGPTIVCLHAIGHDARDFDELAKRLGGAFEFVAIDWPGQGESPQEWEPASADRYAQILSAALDVLKLETVFLLGNSIGGAAAISYAVSHPTRVRGLILCNPGGLQRVSFIARVICRRMAALFGSGARGDKDFPRKHRRYHERQVLPAPTAAARREEIIEAGPRNARALREAWESFSKPEAYIGHLMPQIACPVFFSWAKGDQLVAWSRSKRAALSAPKHQVQFFEGGHAAFFLEAPEKFDAALRTFVAKTLS